MSSQDPSPDQPPHQGTATPRHADPATDPGRAQPFETLYRGHGTGASTSHRVTVRHYETSLTPPDEPDPRDQFHWLYRPEPSPEPEPALDPAPATPRHAVSAGSEVELAPVTDDELVEPRRSRRVLVVFLVLLVVAGVAIAAVLVGNRTDTGGAAVPALASGGPSSPPATTGPSAASTVASPSNPAASNPAVSKPAASTPVPYAGAVAAVDVQQTGADCQAPPSTDGAGQRVRYDPEELSDGNLSTAWRCEGSGKNHSLVFTFGVPTAVAEVGLVNGYAKIDPKNRAHRYGEYRRLQRVRWTFPNGVSFNQDLADRTETLQKMRIPPQTVDQVRLTILGSTSPGQQAKSRDAVLISEVGFATPQS